MINGQNSSEYCSLSCVGDSCPKKFSGIVPDMGLSLPHAAGFFIMCRLSLFTDLVKLDQVPIQILKC